MKSTGPRSATRSPPRFKLRSGQRSHNSYQWRRMTPALPTPAPGLSKIETARYLASDRGDPNEDDVAFQRTEVVVGSSLSKGPTQQSQQGSINTESNQFQWIAMRCFWSPFSCFCTFCFVIKKQTHNWLWLLFPVSFYILCNFSPPTHNFHFGRFFILNRKLFGRKSSISF